MTAPKDDSAMRRNYDAMASTLTAAQKRGTELLNRARAAELRVAVATARIELLATRTKANILGRNEIEKETNRILDVLKETMTMEQLQELYPPGNINRKEPVE